MTHQVDVVIVGAGPCGLAAAISAMRAGLSVQVFDKGPVVSTIAAYPTYATFFSTAEKLSIGGLPFVLAEAKPTRKDALAYYRAAVAHFGIPVRQYETVERITGTAGDFTVHVHAAEAGTTARCRAVIVATGYFGAPNALGIPGETMPHVSHVYREGHEAFQQAAVVVGGGNSSAEAALDLWRVGARVTLVHFGPSWDKRIKPWVLPDITNRIAEGGIAVRWNSRVTAVEPGWVTITPSGLTKKPLPSPSTWPRESRARICTVARCAAAAISRGVRVCAHTAAGAGAVAARSAKGTRARARIIGNPRPAKGGRVIVPRNTATHGACHGNTAWHHTTQVINWIRLRDPCPRNRNRTANEDCPLVSSPVPPPPHRASEHVFP